MSFLQKPVCAIEAALSSDDDSTSQIHVNGKEEIRFPDGAMKVVSPKK